MDRRMRWIAKRVCLHDDVAHQATELAILHLVFSPSLFIYLPFFIVLSTSLSRARSNLQPGIEFFRARSFRDATSSRRANEQANERTNERESNVSEHLHRRGATFRRASSTSPARRLTRAREVYPGRGGNLGQAQVERKRERVPDTTGVFSSDRDRDASFYKDSGRTSITECASERPRKLDPRPGGGAVSSFLPSVCVCTFLSFSSCLSSSSRPRRLLHFGSHTHTHIVVLRAVHAAYGKKKVHACARIYGNICVYVCVCS